MESTQTHKLIQQQFRYLTSGYVFLLTFVVSLFLIFPEKVLEKLTIFSSGGPVIITIFAGYPLGYIFYQIQYWIYHYFFGGCWYNPKVYQYFKTEHCKDDAWPDVIAKHDFALFDEKYDRIRERIFFLVAKVYRNLSVIVAIIIAHICFFFVFPHTSYPSQYIIFVVVNFMFIVFLWVDSIYENKKLLAFEKKFAKEASRS